MTFPYATVGGDFVILDPQRTLLVIFRHQHEGKGGSEKLTHWMFAPDLEVGHTNFGEAMTMDRKTYVVLSMALLMKLRSGNRVLEGMWTHR